MSLRRISCRLCERRLQQDVAWGDIHRLRKRRAGTWQKNRGTKCRAAGDPQKKVSFKDEVGEIEDEMRPYVYGERRRPGPKPKAWMSTGEARMTIDARDHLHANRKGKELAPQLVSICWPDTTPSVPIVTHASDSPLISGVTTGSRRCVAGSRSRVGIMVEGFVTSKEKKLVEEMSTPMRLNAASGGVEAKCSTALIHDGERLDHEGMPERIVAREKMRRGRFLV